MAVMKKEDNVSPSKRSIIMIQRGVYTFWETLDKFIIYVIYSLYFNSQFKNTGAKPRYFYCYLFKVLKLKNSAYEVPNAD